MKTKPKAPFTGEECFLLNQAITRRILFLEDQMVTFWKEGNDHGLKHVARQVAVLWDLFYRISHVWNHGKWPEEKKNVRAS